MAYEEYSGQFTERTRNTVDQVSDFRHSLTDESGYESVMPSGDALRVPGLFGKLMLEDVEPAYQKLSTLSDASLESRIAVRRKGSARDMLTNMYDANLTQWQENEERLPDDRAAFWHGAGLLYGSQIITARYRRATGDVLEADSPAAHNKALNVVMDSYSPALGGGTDHTWLTTSGPILPSMPLWEKEAIREQIHLNSSAVRIASILLRQRVQNLDIAAGWPSPHDYGRSLAVQAGLLDAIIYGEAYANHLHGTEMELSPKWSNEILTSKHSMHFSLLERQPDGSLRPLPPLRVAALDGLVAAASSLGPSPRELCWRTVTVKDHTYPALFQRSVVQTGADQFERVHTIVAMQRRSDQPYPWDLVMDPRSPFSGAVTGIYKLAELVGKARLGSVTYARGLATRFNQVAESVGPELEVSMPLKPDALSETQRQLREDVITRMQKR